jgi:hypothetical protein
MYSCSGFDSLTAKFELARDITQDFVYQRKPTVLLHLGDYDPSGVSIYDTITEDVHAFIDRDVRSAIPEDVALFHRAALTDYQIGAYRLTTYPAKVTDGRSKKWLSTGRETCQLEALPPDILAEVLRSTIERYFDLKQLKIDREAEDKEVLEITRSLPAPAA